MFDWKVDVITKNGQVRTVKVYNFTLKLDAEAAALSQSGGGRVYYSAPFVEDIPNPPQNTISEPFRGFDVSNVEFDYSTKEGLIGGYIAATILPTFILWCINPIPAILFNIAFARWWFTD
jgi:hypothetical protein